MSNQLQNQACQDCLLAMEEVKGASLSRIACANCQHAHELVSATKADPGEQRTVLFGFRCSTCGKFCWTRTGLAHHRLTHVGPWERN